MKIFYKYGDAHTFKTTRINRVLEKLLGAIRYCDLPLRLRKGRGRGPNFSDRDNGRRVDVSQDYFISKSNDNEYVHVRIRSAGDSEETVRKNVDDARRDSVDVLIMAVRDEKWLPQNAVDSREPLEPQSAVDDGDVEHMVKKVMDDIVGRLHDGV